MDDVSYLRVGFSLLFIIGLILLCAALFRKFVVEKNLIGGGNRKRLAVVESLPLDSRRRLVLIRRDSTEHLILTGGGNDIVVEAGIVSEEKNPQQGISDGPSLHI